MIVVSIPATFPHDPDRQAIHINGTSAIGWVHRAAFMDKGERGYTEQVSLFPAVIQWLNEHAPDQWMMLGPHIYQGYMDHSKPVPMVAINDPRVALLFKLFWDIDR